MSEDLNLDGRVCQHCQGTKMGGIEVLGIYDGVLFWECLDCGGTQQRWSEHDGALGLHLSKKAKPYMHGPLKVKNA